MDKTRASTVSLPAGGGAFELPELTIGVFEDAQPTHRISLGSDRRMDIPIARHGGWIMPAGAEGLCLFEAPLAMRSVSFEASLLSEVGLKEPDRIRPIMGALDPVLLQMVLSAESFAAGGALYRETMQRALAAHLAEIVGSGDMGLPDIADMRLKRVVEHVHAHLADDLTLDGLAAIAGLSPYHFARAFKAALGASPLQYVITARMETAQVLLKTTRKPVAEIAWQVGYDDTSRFGRHFKTRVGATPAAYRRA